VCVCGTSAAKVKSCAASLFAQVESKHYNRSTLFHPLLSPSLSLSFALLLFSKMIFIFSKVLKKARLHFMLIIRTLPSDSLFLFSCLPHYHIIYRIINLSTLVTSLTTDVKLSHFYQDCSEEFSFFITSFVNY